MIETFAILPVKAFNRAKSRLSSVLTKSQRATIARLMAIDVLRTLCAVTGIDRVLIVGQGNEHAELAEAFDCDYVADDPSRSVSENVARAAHMPLIYKSKTLLVIPTDIPLLRVADIRALLSKNEGGVTICRAMRDGGTNAMMMSPPGNVTFSFGSNSAERHALAAQSAGQKVTVLDDIAFRRDIDEPEDLAWLSRYGKHGETVNYLKRSGIAARLVQLLPESIAS